MLFQEVILQKNSGLKDFRDFFYKTKGDYDYKICRETQLNYLGEFLERFERENINFLDIIMSIASLSDELKECQINEGQAEDFISKVESIIYAMEGIEYKIAYSIFLQKIGFSEKADDFICEVLNELEFNENFLLVALALRDGNLKLTDKIKKSSLEILNHKSLSLDVEFVCSNRRNSSISCVSEEASFTALRELIKSFALKAKDFDDSKRFGFIKALKLIGSKNSNYEDVKEFISLTEQEYYFLCLLVAQKVYSFGSSLKLINQTLCTKLMGAMDPNSTIYQYYDKIEIILPDSKLMGGWFSLKDMKFIDVKREYYQLALDMYLAKKNSIPFRNIKAIFENEGFLEFFEGYANKVKDDSNINKEQINDLFIDIITATDDDRLVKICFELIYNVDDIDKVKKLVLIEKSLISDSEIRNLFTYNMYGENGLRIFTFYATRNCCLCIRDIATFIEGHNLSKVSYLICKFIMENIEEIKSGDVFNSRTLNDYKPIADLALKYVKTMESKEEKVKAVKIIEEFYFLLISNCYCDFIFKIYNDKELKMLLEISDDEVNEVVKYMVSKNYENYNKTLNEYGYKLCEVDNYYNSYCNLLNKLLYQSKNWGSHMYKSTLKELSVLLNTMDSSLEEKVKTATKETLEESSDLFIKDYKMGCIGDLIHLGMIGLDDGVSLLRNSLIENAKSMGYKTLL